MGFLDKARDKQIDNLLTEVSEHLLQGESVVSTCLGVGSKRSGKTYSGGLALTESRVIFVGRALTEKLVDSHPLDGTTGITTTHGAMIGELGIKNGLASEEYKIPKKLMDDFVAEVRRVADSRPAAPASTSSEPLGGSVADELGKLAALHSQGLLTDEEFADAKARVLDEL